MFRFRLMGIGGILITQNVSKCLTASNVMHVYDLHIHMSLSVTQMLETSDTKDTITMTV